MAYANRQPLIAALETARNSRVLTYITADRPTHPPDVPGFAIQLDGAPFYQFMDQVRAIGHVPRLDLFIYTRGGATDSVWPLISMLREHTDHLGVLVPFRAHSGGTMICLGADELALGPFAELSPIDPTTGNQFNPVDPNNPQARYGISVEDVTSYFKLADERADIHDEGSRLEVFKELTRQVHPLALGNVQRVYLQIRRLATRLLALHLDELADHDLIESIKKALTEEFFSHVHSIPRSEAIPLLGPWAHAATDDEQTAMSNLFDSYVETLELRAPFSLPDHMGANVTQDLTSVGGFIETTEASDIYTTRMHVMQRPSLPPGVQVQIPPGAVLPLGPWVGRQYDFQVDSTGWTTNVGGL